MAGYSRDDLVDRLVDDEPNGYGLDELEAEAAVDKFYEHANGGALPSGVASVVTLAAAHIVGTDAYWEK